MDTAGLKPFTEVERALLVMEILHAPHPQGLGLLLVVGGEHFCQQSTHEQIVSHACHSGEISTIASVPREHSSGTWHGRPPWALAQGEKVLISPTGGRVTLMIHARRLQVASDQPLLHTARSTTLTPAPATLGPRPSQA